MKNHCIFLFACITLMSCIGLQAQVAITNDGSAPHSSAMLEVKSTNRGMLVPRVTTAQRTGINSPATGLLVYDTETQSFWVKNGNAWQEIRDGNITSLEDNDSDTKVMVEKSADEDIIRFDLGGTERMVLRPDRLELIQGNNNLIIGQNSGLQNIGSFNSFLGHSTGNSNILGEFNTAAGYRALYHNTDGNYNTALGCYSLFENVAGEKNTAAGYAASGENRTGNHNVAFGSWALPYNRYGSNNVAVGTQTLFYDTIGNSNVAIGYRALYYNKNRSYNVAVGDSALYNNSNGASGNTQGSCNTAIGSKALALNVSGYRNTAVGYQSLYNNISGIENWAGGYKALYQNSTGSGNTATGKMALTANTDGSYNTAMGCGALQNNTSGGQNTAIGYKCSLINDLGTNNTALGYHALYNNNEGSNNTALGSLAGYGNTMTATFSNNVLLGYGAGFSLYYGSNNILIGYSAGDGMVNGSNNIVIGYNIDASTMDANNEMILGHPDLLFGDIANKKIGVGTTSPECQLHISHIQDAMLILEADANNIGETDNPRLELRQDGELVIGALGYTGENSSIYTNSIGNSMYLVNEYSSALQFGTDSILAMTILSDGNVGIGTTAPTQVLDVNGNARFRAVGSGTYSLPLNLTSTGILTTSTSDVRMKTNVKEIDDGLIRVLNMRGVSFNWLNDPDGKKMIGFVAQEVENAVPELVYTNPADGFKGVNYAEMTAVLVEAVKEQQRQIEALQKKVDELENLVGSTVP